MARIALACNYRSEALVWGVRLRVSTCLSEKSCLYDKRIAQSPIGSTPEEVRDVVVVYLACFRDWPTYPIPDSILAVDTHCDIAWIYWVPAASPDDLPDYP